MRQLGTISRIGNAILTVFSLTLILMFLASSQKTAAQSGSGRTTQTAPKKKASKSPKVAVSKPVKTASSKISKTSARKVVEPKKTVERPRQVEVSAADKKKPIVEEPIAAAPLNNVPLPRETEEVQKQAESITPEIKKVVLQRKREAMGNTELATSAPTAKIERIRIYQNIYQDGAKGVRIHVKFRTTNLEETEAKLTAYFYNADSEPKFNGESENYLLQNETPSITESFVSSSKESIFSDYTLFMPYNELERVYSTYENNGSFRVKMQIQISNFDNSLLAVSSYSYMTIE